MTFNVNRKIVGGNKIFVIAEPSGNHNGSISNLKKIIEKSARCGADAIKIQLYDPESITLDTLKKDFLIDHKSKWKNYDSLFNLYKKACTPISWAEDIFSFAKKKNITIFSSVFDLKGLRALEKVNCPAYKIASGEVNDLDLLENVSKTKKPVFFSTGLATKKDIDFAFNTLQKNSKNICIMKCNSIYPTPKENTNLSDIKFIEQNYNAIVGFSDHSIGIDVPLYAIAAGAKVIEKHIKLDNKKTVDSFFSLNIKDFKILVKKIRELEKIIGFSKSYSYKKIELKNKRSLYVSKKISVGDTFSKDNIKSVRPGLSIQPKFLYKFLGKKSRSNLTIGERLNLTDIKK